MPVADYFSNLWQSLRGVKPATAQSSRTRARGDVARIPLGGGRVSLEDPARLAFSGLQVLSQLSADEFWRINALDSRTLDRAPAWKVMELLCELSPEINRAYFDFLRMANPGYKITVTRAGGQTEDAQGKALLDAFFKLLKDLYGSADIPINRLFASLFLRGEMVAELVFGADARTMADFATPDPRAFDFQQVTDEIRGQIHRFGQWQASVFVPLDVPTIKYVPLDPLPGKPRGMSMIGSALFSGLFLVGLLHDLRRVVAQQGWPRIDLAVQLEKLIAALPEEIQDDPVKFKEAVQQTIDEIVKAYGQLEPDDAYVHTDVVTVNRGVGVVDASSLGAIDGVIAALERMCVRALKTMPLNLALDQATNEGQANRQWEIYAAGIKAIQHLVEGLLESLFELGLRANGRQTSVQFRFAELRAAEMLRDAQTEALKIKNERDKYAAGWTSQDEGAQVITGHDADVPEPRQMATAGGAGNLIGAQPDPGANRAARADALRLANQFAARGNRNAAALALLLSAAVNEPGEREQAEAEDWWRRAGDDDSRALIDAEVVE